MLWLDSNFYSNGKEGVVLCWKGHVFSYKKGTYVQFLRNRVYCLKQDEVSHFCRLEGFWLARELVFKVHGHLGTHISILRVQIFPNQLSGLGTANSLKLRFNLCCSSTIQIINFFWSPSIGGKTLVYAVNQTLQLINHS